MSRPQRFLLVEMGGSGAATDVGAAGTAPAAALDGSGESEFGGALSYFAGEDALAPIETSLPPFLSLARRFALFSGMGGGAAGVSAVAGVAVAEGTSSSVVKLSLIHI